MKGEKIISTTEMVDVTLTVNGKKSTYTVWKHEKLVDFLHDQLDLPGTRFCCGIGVCRACTVLSRNVQSAPKVPLLSCSTAVVSLNNHYIDTVEGLAQSANQITPLQEEFLKHFSFQCGYCTPGFLMAATALIEQLKQSPIHESEINQTIEQACSEHICRCTGYVRYYQAIRKVIENTPGTIIKEGSHA